MSEKSLKKAYEMGLNNASKWHFQEWAEKEAKKNE